MDELASLQDRVRTALGQEPPDLLLRNVQLLDVYSARIVPADVAVRGGRIVSTLPGRFDQAARVIEGRGRFAMPGFIDAHIHIESTLLTPASLAEVVVPTGTTSLFVDPMEIANVAGMAGLEAFLDSLSDLPYRIFLQVSSRVPTAPGLETSGGELGFAEVEKILAWPQAISLGELDPSKVLGLSEDHLRKVLAAHNLRKIANGHAIGLEGGQLEAYAAAGLMDDHECVTVDQLEQRLARGMAVMVREGSSERNLVELIRGVVDQGIDTRHLMFCTDDKHPSDIRREGHINFNVREAIRLGVPPLAAIQMATLNPAEHFRLDHSIGVLAPGRWADLTLCESLEDLRPDLVAVGGQVVAEGGRLVAEVPPSRFPDWLKQTVRPRKGLRPEDFELRANGSFARVKAIEVVPDQIYNFLREAEVPVRDGRARPDLENDVLLLAVVERHGKNGNLALGWTRGFGLKRGAMASSVAHDHHNLLVVGTNEADMLGCVRALEQSQGGFVAVEQGEVVALLPLPLAGLMSERPSLEVEAELARVDAAAASMGCRLKAPFMTLSFISLPSIPEAGFSDKGLIEVASQRLIPVFLEGR